MRAKLSLRRAKVPHGTEWRVLTLRLWFRLARHYLRPGIAIASAKNKPNITSKPRLSALLPIVKTPE